MVARGELAKRAVRVVAYLVRRWRTLLSAAVLTGGESWAHVRTAPSNTSLAQNAPLDSGNARSGIATYAVQDLMETAIATSEAVRRPASSPYSRARTAVGTGLVALAVGAALQATVGIGVSGDASILGSAVTMVAWAWMRFFAMRVAPFSKPDVRSSKDDTALLASAWGIGLLPFALALTPELRAIAWLASGWLTRRTAIGSGLPAARATRLVVVAWGLQAAFTILGWFARSALILALTVGA